MNRSAWLVCCVSLSACGNTGAPAEDYGPLLSSLTQQLILPEHQAFAAQADALLVAVQALVDRPDADSLAAAQSAWRESRAAFRVLDALHLGPMVTLHLSERIDAAPSDPEGIEALASAEAELDEPAVERAGGRKKGFLGLEYLFFPAPSTTAAPPALAEDGAATRRRVLALGMAHEIAKSAHQLQDAWSSGSGDFATQLQSAGAGSAQYRTQRAAVNDLAGGVGYALESVVRGRLALPLGKSTGGTPAPELDVTPRSDNAVADMQASLAGVAALYADPGFSTIIQGKSGKLDQRVREELAQSQLKLEAIPAPFADALVNHTPLIQAAYDALRALKATWNTEVSSVLGASVQISDTDGD